MNRILVVEDQQKHMQEAVAALKEEGVAEILTADDSSTACKILDQGRVDGVITDIFIPEYFLPEHYRKPSTGEQPCGLAVALAAEEKGIPFVLCTSGYHHGLKYNWINKLAGKRKWKQIADTTPTDLSNNEEEAPSKNWKWALRILRSNERFVD